MESINGKPIESVRLRPKGTKARKKAFKILFSDAEGFYEFNELDADTYDIFAIKTGFKSTSQTVELKDFWGKKIEIKLRSIQVDEQKKDLIEDKRGTITPHFTPSPSPKKEG